MDVVFTRVNTSMLERESHCQTSVPGSPAGDQQFTIRNYLIIFSMMLIPNTDSIASLDLVSEYNDCDCCLVTDSLMIQDGVRMVDDTGSEQLCYKGILIQMKMIEEGLRSDVSGQVV